jgi:hypothetical protein
MIVQTGALNTSRLWRATLPAILLGEYFVSERTSSCAHLYSRDAGDKTRILPSMSPCFGDSTGAYSW